MRAKLNYIVACLIIQISLGYLILFQLPAFVVLWFDSFPIRFLLLLASAIGVTVFAGAGYVYLFPPSAVVRTNISWLIAAWGAAVGFPATAMLYLINRVEFLGQEIFDISFIEFGGASGLVTIVSIIAMLYTNREYNRLLRPENVPWSTRTPVVQ